MALITFLKLLIKPSIIFFIIAVLTGHSFAVSAAMDPNAIRQTNNHTVLSESLEELIQQLRQERSDYYTQKTQYDMQIQKARENHNILKDELDELREQETELNEQILKYQDEVEKIKKQLVLKTTLENVLQEQIKPFLANERTAIMEGIPYKQQERLERLEAAQGDVNEPNSTTAADRMEHTWSYALEELRIGRSSETYTARAKTGDNILPYARYFRVGSRILGYVTEDGKHTAMWLSLPNQNEFSVINDKNQSQQVRKAVEILDHQQALELIMLPVSLMPAKAEEDNSNAAN
ncbi:MAG: DUF3450 family protein [Sedimentisphaerales bacterium]|nr:DUF3450 family protein [Sedimentisphaerales bacterium]